MFFVWFSYDFCIKFFRKIKSQSNKYKYKILNISDISHNKFHKIMSILLSQNQSNLRGVNVLYVDNLKNKIILPEL